MTLFEQRRLLLAGFSQTRSAVYAAHARMIRDDYMGTWLGRLLWSQKHMLEIYETDAAMAEIHALNARMLMGFQED